MTFQTKQAETHSSAGFLDGFVPAVPWAQALVRVWSLAAILFISSGGFFLLMTGVVKMLIPLALFAVGLGVIGSVQVFAKANIYRQSDD